MIVAPTGTGFPVPSANVTSISSLPPYPVNVTSTSSSSEDTTTPSATPAPFVPDGCPALNGTTLTATDGEVFLVLCDTDFNGRNSIGLSEPDLQACVEECSVANRGFSATRCLGVSYRPQLANNCYLKTHVDNQTTNTTYEVVSAILITPFLNFPNATNTTTSIALPTFNTTGLPLGPTATIPSLASITPSPSINATTTPPPSYFPSLSMNDSRTEWSSVCSNCPGVFTSTLYSTTTVYLTVAAPSMH